MLAQNPRTPSGDGAPLRPPVDATSDVLFSAPSKLHGERNEASVLFDAEAMGARPGRPQHRVRKAQATEHSAMIDLDALPRPGVLRRPPLGTRPSRSLSDAVLPPPRVSPGGAPFPGARRPAVSGSPSRALAVAGAIGFIGVALAAALLLPV